MARNVAVHPLAIVGIADHHTRVKKGGSPQSARLPAVGLLMGTRRGAQSNVMDGVDISYRDTGTEILIEESQVETKRALTMAVFPDYEVLGWYTVGSQLEELHARVHQSIAGMVDSPLFLLMRPLGLGADAPAAKDDATAPAAAGAAPPAAAGPSAAAPADDDALPISLYESGLTEVDHGFKAVIFQLETAEAEQISIEHVAKVTPKEGVTQTELHLSGLITSLSTLQSRVQVIADYLDRISEQPGSEPDPALLRSIAQLASLLPTVKPDSKLNGSTSAGLFADTVGSSVTDGLLTTNLATMTNAALLLSKLSEKFKLAFEGRIP